MPRRRLGVALLLPPTESVEVDGLRRACGDPSLLRIPPHVTLVPPVNVNEEAVVEALALVRKAVASSEGFVVRVGPAETFHPDNPVLYLRVDDAGGAVSGLRRLVFVGPLERDVTWPFVPHVTLCDEMNEADLTAAVRVLAHYERDVGFDALTVLEERRDPDGHRRWIPVAETAFGASALVGTGGFEVEMTPSRSGGPDVDAFLSVEACGLEPDDEREVPVGAVPLVVVARLEHEVAGCLLGWTAAEVAGLSAVLVAEAERGLGIGGHLLSHFLSAVAERGARDVLAGSLTDEEEGLLRARGLDAERSGILRRLI